MAKDTRKSGVDVGETVDLSSSETGSSQYPLAQLLEHPASGVLYAPAKPEFVPVFLAAVEADDPNARRIAVERLGALRDSQYIDVLLRCQEDSNWDVRYWAAFGLFEITDDIEYLVDGARRELLKADDAQSLRRAIRFAYNVPEARWMIPLLRELIERSRGQIRQAGIVCLARICPDQSFVQTLCLESRNEEAATDIFRFFYSMGIDCPDWLRPDNFFQLFPDASLPRSERTAFAEPQEFIHDQPDFRSAIQFCRSLLTAEELPPTARSELITILSWDWRSAQVEEDDEKSIFRVPAAIARYGRDAEAAIPNLLRFAKITRDPLARLYAWHAIRLIAPEFPNLLMAETQATEFAREIVDAWTDRGILTSLERDHVEPSEERKDPVTSAQILAGIDSVQRPIIEQLNAWLSSFEGKTYSPEEASDLIAEIRHVVARAGCELLIDEIPVGLSSSTSNRARSASIIAKTLREHPQRNVYGRVSFPPVTAVPIRE